MQPIVHGLEAKYHTCIRFERVNILDDSPLRKTLRPFGTPEFFFLDAEGQLIYRWFGLTYASEFESELLPRCSDG